MHVHLYDSATAIDTVELEDEDKVFFPDSDEDERSGGNVDQVGLPLWVWCSTTTPTIDCECSSEIAVARSLQANEQVMWFGRV